jgi:hypothetical protein
MMRLRGAKTMTHANEYESSGTSPSDFTIRDEGSILLLTPHTEPARSWIHEHIGPDNGYQPYFPTIVIERRYVYDILDGIDSAGLAVSR